jgi:hypothetical protein
MLGSLLLSALLFLVSLQAQSQADGKDADNEQAWNICPASPELHGESETQSWFEGTFGARFVRLYLDRVGNGVVGTFYSTDDWRPIDIGGEWSANDSLTLGIVMDVETAPSTESGLTAQVIGQELVGDWKQDLTTSTVPIHLHRVSQPQCDGRGPWRTFSDKQWPIMFSFPADWHVEVNDTELSLTCPDPSWMAYAGVNLTLTKSGKNEIPLCGGHWMFAGNDCDRERELDPRTLATVQTAKGITRYSGWGHEHRLYCNIGGYRGQGDGDAEVLQVGETWIEIQAEQGTAQILPKFNESLEKFP